MKIIVYDPFTTGIYKDDTMMFCEQFEKLGHTVIKINAHKPSLDILKGGDVILSPYEAEILQALCFGQNLCRCLSL